MTCKTLQKLTGKRCARLCATPCRKSSQRIRAAPGRLCAFIEAAPVSPALNTLAAILIFVPVERGGAAVLIEAYDNERKVASLSLARPAAWSDLRGYFSRYAHARTVLQQAAEDFAQLLEHKHANRNEPA